MPKSNERQLTAQVAYNMETYCMWLDEDRKGLDDVAVGRNSDARAGMLAIQTRRSASRIRNAVRTEPPDL